MGGDCSSGGCLHIRRRKQIRVRSHASLWAGRTDVQADEDGVRLRIRCLRAIVKRRICVAFARHHDLKSLRAKRAGYRLRELENDVFFGQAGGTACAGIRAAVRCVEHNGAQGFIRLWRRNGLLSWILLWLTLLRACAGNVSHHAHYSKATDCSEDSGAPHAAEDSRNAREVFGEARASCVAVYSLQTKTLMRLTRSRRYSKKEL